MATYVLVHGAYCGGFVWSKVARLLRKAGHDVYAPTLTGLGERVNLAHRGIDLDTHITDIVNVLEYEDLRRVILVGQSYAGMVISGVAARLPKRLAHLVYLDAAVPEDGEAITFYAGQAEAGLREKWERMLAEGTWSLSPGERPPDDPLAGVVSRSAPQPLQTYLQPIEHANPSAVGLDCTFIYCTGEKSQRSDAMTRISRDRARARGWRYREFPAGHAALWTSPDETAALLLEVAELEA
jgi:pimeloyl-ACP methyl ester carboxylesterase